MRKVPAEKLRDENNTWLLHSNIRSLNKNFAKLNLLVITIPSEPSIICLSETWLKDDTPFELFRILD